MGTGMAMGARSREGTSVDCWWWSQAAAHPSIHSSMILPWLVALGHIHVY